MNLFVKIFSIKTILVCAVVIPQPRSTQAQLLYRYISDPHGVEVRDNTMIFQRSSTLDLMELYAPMGGSHAGKGSASTGPTMDDHSTSYIDGLKLSEGGYIKIRVYDFDEELWAKGNIIYGAVSKTSGRNFDLGCWDVSDEFYHWDELGGDRVFLPSTNIKFLSQYETLGSVCSVSKMKTFFRMLEAAFTVHHLVTYLVNSQHIPSSAIVAQFLLAGQIMSVLYQVYESILEYHWPNSSLELSALIDDLVKQNPLMKSISTCEFPRPIVLVEIIVHDYIFYEAKIPGLPPIVGNRLFEKNNLNFLPKPAGFKKVDFTDVAESDHWIMPGDYQLIPGEAKFRQIPGFPVPDVLLLPTFERDADFKRVRFKIPETGRLTVIGERETMKILHQNVKMEGNVREFDIEIIALNAMEVKKKGLSEPLPYDMYAFVGQPGYQFDLDVSAEGPFLIHFGFEEASNFPGHEPEIILRQKVVPDETDKITAGERIDHAHARVYPNPTNGMFQVLFHLEESSAVNIVLNDIMGRVIYQEEMKLTAGMHSKALYVQTSPGPHLLHVKIGKNKQSVKILFD
ncbi:MAG: T9SS type A sorting domain-containing protein [Bacteroidota bacterium]